MLSWTKSRVTPGRMRDLPYTKRESHRSQYYLGRYHDVHRTTYTGSRQAEYHKTSTAALPSVFTVIILKDGKPFYSDEWRDDPYSAPMDILWRADSRAS
jgi:hypothetical protein